MVLAERGHAASAGPDRGHARGVGQDETATALAHARQFATADHPPDGRARNAEQVSSVGDTHGRRSGLGHGTNHINLVSSCQTYQPSGLARAEDIGYHLALGMGLAPILFAAGPAAVSLIAHGYVPAIAAFIATGLIIRLLGRPDPTFRKRSS